MDITAFSGCGEFGGELLASHTISQGGEPVFTFSVDGTAQVHCAPGTVVLTAIWKCDGTQFSSQIADTTTVQGVSGVVGSCDAPTAGHVQLCYSSSSGSACTSSESA